ncbi:MAG: CAP domain-containing protein, partial [Acidimicrobiales bacterium]
MQNIVMGGLAFLVAVVTMIAATLYLTGGDDVSTETALPVSGNAIEASATEDSAAALRSAAAGSGGPIATLDVAGASVNGLVVTTTSMPTTTTSTSTTLLTTTTVATTTSTTAAPTSVTVSTTAPLSEASTAPPASDLTPTSTTLPGTSQTTAATVDDMVSSTIESTVVTTPTTAETTSTIVATTTTVAPTTSTIAVSTTQTPTTTDMGELNEIEREILRLTNELRTDPNGPLRRQGPVIDCGGRVRVAKSGKYEPIGKVEGHLVASLQVSRPWSAQMTVRNFEHQPRAGVEALQNAGIQVRSAGENIAYTSYPDKAQRFFTGWRESDGHFCNMMDP